MQVCLCKIGAHLLEKLTICIVAIQQCFNYFVFAGKILNPFTVLQFRNDDCRGEDNLIGTCYSVRGKNASTPETVALTIP